PRPPDAKKPNRRKPHGSSREARMYATIVTNANENARQRELSSAVPPMSLLGEVIDQPMVLNQRRKNPRRSSSQGMRSAEVRSSSTPSAGRTMVASISTGWRQLTQ